MRTNTSSLLGKTNRTQQQRNRNKFKKNKIDLLKFALTENTSGDARKQIEKKKNDENYENRKLNAVLAAEAIKWHTHAHAPDCCPFDWEQNENNKYEKTKFARMRESFAAR